MSEYVYGEKNVVLFNDGEDAWFWFCRCEVARNDLASFEPSSDFTRPCLGADIYRAVKSLIVMRSLTAKHLSILLNYGMKFTPPDSRIKNETMAAKLWEEAIERLGMYLKKKGLVNV